MNPVQLTSLLLEAEYSYSCLMITVPPEIADFAMDWGRLNIQDESVFVDEEDGSGRELDMHVTVKYGLTDAKVPDAVYKIAHETTPFPILIGKVSLFKNQKFDVVKCEVQSQKLHELNAKISSSVPCVDTYPTYNPHMTIAYVLPGSCDHLDGTDIFAEADNRQFVAPGMVFKGAGSDEDSSRVEEVLLFSRKKAKEAVSEAVVGPSEVDMTEVERIIKTAQQASHGDAKLFTEIANEELAPYRIKFAMHRDMDMAPGCPGMANDEGIFLRPPTDYQVRDTRFFQGIRGLLYHELVHSHQMSRMDDPAHVASQALAYVAPNGRLDQERYLKQKQEIMAYAASLVDSWKRQGLDQAQMMHRLRSGNWGFGAKYWHARKTHPDVFKRFIRYASEYIKLGSGLKESTFENAPFAGLSFPSNSDDVSRFLRKRRKEQKKRPIL